MSNYLQQSDLEAYLDTTLTANGIALFNLLLPSVQDEIDIYCNRSWQFVNPVTDYFDAIQDTTIPSISYLFQPTQPPISTIISLSVSGTLLDLDYVYNYGTYVKLWVRPQTIAMTNPLGYLSVELQYDSASAGVVPNPIKLATIEWMARKMLIAKYTNKDATMLWVGGVKLGYKPDLKPGIPDFVRTALDQFRLEPIDRF